MNPTGTLLSYEFYTERVCVCVCYVNDASAEAQDNNICPLIAVKAEDWI